jgi:hypothetical protein
LDCLVLFSLGLDRGLLLDAVRGARGTAAAAVAAAAPPCPVYLTETYGILGFDEERRENVELMELGRGSEYGFAGGSGGEGCLVAGFSGGARSGHSLLGGTDLDSPLLSSSSTCMVVADGSGTWASDAARCFGDSPPLHYGGISKSCYALEDEGWVRVPYFWVEDAGDDGAGGSSTVGVSAFSEDQEAGPAVQSLLSSARGAGRAPTGDVGLFPCFTRGVNQYGREGVETSQILAVMPRARVYGMFAHGELGPVAFSGFAKRSSFPIPCTQHSMTSILALHTADAPRKT